MLNFVMFARRLVNSVIGPPEESYQQNSPSSTDMKVEFYSTFSLLLLLTLVYFCFLNCCSHEAGFDNSVLPGNQSSLSKAKFSFRWIDLLEGLPD